MYSRVSCGLFFLRAPWNYEDFCVMALLCASGDLIGVIDWRVRGFAARAAFFIGLAKVGIVHSE